MIERPFYYSQRQQLPAGLIKYDQRIEIRQQADFILRGFGAYVSNGTTAWRAKRADASWFTGPDFSHLSGFCVTGGFARWTPIYPQVYYPRSGAFVYDLQNLDGAVDDNNVYPFLVGVERYDDGSLPSPALPAAYVEQKHSITITQTLNGLDNQLIDIPVQTVTGDAFVIRSLSWRFDVASNEPFTMACRLRDEYGRDFMNDWVPMRLLFAGPTEANSLYPAEVFPEMVISPNGAYKLDLWNRTEAGPFTVELCFDGVRLVEVTGGGA
jgi:hypothetical protein